MATIYVRDVPDGVRDILRERATAEGTSLSSYVARELAALAARPSNAEVVARLKSRRRSTGPTTSDITAELAAARR